MAVSLHEYNKAVESLTKVLSHELNDIVRDATIQRFEFCVELAWKCSRKSLGTSTSSPKGVIREMGQEGLIEDVSLWLRSVDYRNLSVHTYNESMAEEVYKFIKDFHHHFIKLRDKLEQS